MAVAWAHPPMPADEESGEAVFVVVRSCLPMLNATPLIVHHRPPLSVTVRPGLLYAADEVTTPLRPSPWHARLAPSCVSRGELSRGGYVR